MCRCGGGDVVFVAVVVNMIITSITIMINIIVVVTTITVLSVTIIITTAITIHLVAPPPPHHIIHLVQVADERNTLPRRLWWRQVG